MDQNAQIRITSDGTADGTKIRLADDTELLFIESIQWSISATTPVATTEIRLRLAPIDLSIPIPQDVENALRLINEYFAQSE